jgi:hypothetical protein
MMLKKYLNESICYFTGHVYERTFNTKKDCIISAPIVAQNLQTGHRTQAHQSYDEHKCSRCGKIKMLAGDPTI